MIRKLEKIGWGQIVKKASLVTQWYNPPASAKDPGLSLGGEDPLEKQPTPVFLPGKSHGREPGGLQSMGSQKVRHDLVTEYTCIHASPRQKLNSVLRRGKPVESI